MKQIMKNAMLLITCLVMVCGICWSCSSANNSSSEESSVKTTAQDDEFMNTKSEAPFGLHYVDTEWMQANWRDVVLVDVRTPEEYAGQAGNERSGHIPGAINLPSQDLFNSDGSTKEDEELEFACMQAGLSKHDEIVVYCVTGVRASNVAQVLEAMGYENISVYAPGFSEWAEDPANELEQSSAQGVEF